MKSANQVAERARARRAEPLKVIYRLIEELRPDPANPRVHGKKQIRQIANSIETFGFNVPMLVDRRPQRDRRATGGCSPAANSAGPRCRRCASIT